MTRKMERIPNKVASGPPANGPTAEPIIWALVSNEKAEAARLVGLGAEHLGPGRGWIVLRDPVGMIFCVTGNHPDNP